MRIHFNDFLDEKYIEILSHRGLNVTREHFSEEILLREIQAIDILVVRSKTQVTKEILQKGNGGKLKLVIRAGVGLDNIAMKVAESIGIKVVSTQGASSRSVAELTLALILDLSRHITKADAAMRQGKFLKSEFRGQEIYGKTIGLIGFGEIGKQVARMAKAMGMKVLYTNTRGEIPQYVGIYEYVDLDELLKQSSYISLHMPGQGDGAPVLTTREFELMKDGSYIINTARGSLIDEKALLYYLDLGKIKAAALDVFSEEPPSDEKLITHEKILLTPHLGSETKEARERTGEAVINTVDNFLELGDDLN